MEPFRFTYKNSTIAYYRFGSGPKPVICFHGYGETAAGFEFLAKHAGNQYSFYAVDLPFHGDTDWKEGLNFYKTDLLQIIQKVIVADNTPPQTSNLKLSLLGFSLGGRITLSVYQAIPEKIEKMILLAPDGLKMNFWYWLATQTSLGNKFFAFTMKKPSWFFGFLKLMNKIKMVNASIFKFVNHYIGDAEVRRLLYNRWTTFRKLRPDLKSIKRSVNAYKTPVRLLYGKHDRIILSSVAEKFRKGIEEHSSLTIINAGHQVLHEKHVGEIIQALYY